MNDSVLAELWKIKDGMAKACGYDVRTLFERLKVVQQVQPGRIVNLQVRKSPPEQCATRVAETAASYPK